MDLAKIKPAEIERDIIHPGTGEPTGLILQIACAHDNRVKAGIREANDWALSIGDKMTDDQKEEYDNRLAAAYIVGFRFEGDAVWNGETPDFSRDVAVEMASTSLIKQQLLKETRDIKPFYKA